MHVCVAVWGDCQLWWGLNLLHSASVLLHADRSGAGSAQSDMSALLHVDGSGAGSAQSVALVFRCVGVVCGVGVFRL